MGCNDCNSCGSQVYWVCWLVEGTDIEIIDITQSWECCKIYEINSLVNIDSPDGSIDVTKTWNTFHIEWFVFNAEDHDKLVAVNSSDTPWFLGNKIVSTCNNILTVTPTQIWIDSWVLDLCIDPSKINVPDEKVAADAGCPSKYLADIMKTNHTDFFSFIKSGCDVSLQVDEQDRFIAHMYTEDVYISGILPTSVSWYWFVPYSLWKSETTMPSQISNLAFAWAIAWAGTDSMVATIPSDWWYTVTFWGSWKTSQNISTVRNQVVIYRWGAEVFRIFDDRFSGSRVAEIPPATWVIQPAELTNLTWYMTDADIPVGVDVAQLSLANNISSFWFGSSRTLQLQAGDIITFLWKVSTVTGNNSDYLSWPQIGYLAQWVDVLTNGRGSGLFVCITEELTKKINH